MAHYDFGIKSLEEFGRLTPGQFMALMKRQAVRFKHECFLSGMVAAQILNTNRRKEDDPVFSAWDFVPDPERESKRNELKRNIHSLFCMLRGGEEDVLKIRKSTIAKLTKAGYKDVETAFDEVFRSWKVEKE
jgi:hypothetical protein